MRVLELQAENFKRLKAISIVPTGHMVEIAGENSEGKTSTLDAIWAALGGKDACPAKPIRSGAEDAIRAGDAKSEVRVVLGENGEPKFRVTRRFRLKEGAPYATDLIVESEDGARFGTPQDILNAMLGEYCFDPLEFTRLKDPEQVVALRRFVPEVDFATVEGLNKRDYDERTDVNRRARDLQGQLNAMPTVEGDLPAEVDIAALEATLGQAAGHNAEIAKRKANREAAEARIQGLADEIERLLAERAKLRTQLEMADPLPEPIDTVRVQEKLAEGRSANAVRAKAQEREKLAQRLKEAEDAEAALTKAIEDRKKKASQAVRQAKMPVPGLGFDDRDGKPYVTLNGEPFDQASQAQKIGASVAIAAAMNPRLRVARIADGSLLDKKSWAALTQYAEANDLQIWIETVSAHTKGAVLIEDGGVVGQDAPPIAEEVGDVL